MKKQSLFIHAHITPGLNERLEMYCQVHGLDVSLVVREALKAYLRQNGAASTTRELKLEMLSVAKDSQKGDVC